MLYPGNRRITADIGKMEIPDSILRKPGGLTPEELEAMHQYNRLGVEMVRGSFGAAVLTEIVEQHVVHYDMNNCERGAGPSNEASISARILSIANAYDTMVSEFSYRHQMSRSQAFAELRKFSGTQFDPDPVERFIGAIKSRHQLHPGAEVQVTKESALSIGLLLEQLIAALDDQGSRTTGRHHRVTAADGDNAWSDGHRQADQIAARHAGRRVRSDRDDADRR
jgi:hypothetical protein